MSRKPLPDRSRPAGRSKWSIRQKLWLIGGVALLGGVAIAVISALEQRLATSERVVTVYRVHGCTCAFPLARSLQGAGYTVRVIELGSLESVRAMLQTPANLHGCHVAAYLDYFVEGHVAPAALGPLAERHPIGLGITTSSSATSDSPHASIAEEEHSLVLLVQPNGRVLPWYQPIAEPTG